MKDTNRWGSYQHFEKVLRKKQNLQEIAADIEDMTDEEIMDIKGQPRWIREHLIRYRDRVNGGGLLPDEIAAEMIRKTSVGIGVPTYDAYKYTGPDVKVTKLEFEINHGDLILVLNLEKMQIKVNHDVETLRPDEIHDILDNCDFIDSVSMPEFRKMSSDYLEEKYSNTDKCDMGDPEVTDEYSMTNIWNRGVKKY